MPVPYNRLVTEHKLDADSLKRIFAADTVKSNPKTKALVDGISDKIRTGIERNRRDYRLFKAMDWAYDQPFYQISYTQLRGLLSSKPDDNKVMETIKSWGLTHLTQDVLDSNGKQCCNPDGSIKKATNLPVLLNIYVPIVMAYITIRWAKLFNDRNVTPHFKYDPAQFTKENRMICDLITQVVQRQSAWFDYPSDTKQTILQTLLYGVCINFPREAWFTEKQEDESGKEIIVREGLRFQMPHPSRMYYDQFHRLSTLNSNSGCAHAGYWELCRYQDIKDHPLYWNKDKISIGASAWFDIGKSDFLEQVYPCAMSFPTSAENGAAGTGSMDRESDAANMYGNGHEQAATLVTNHFERIIPAEHGLGTYKYPIWMRYKFASDSTVLFAEPLSFDRIPAYAYDADFNRSRFRSMALEIVPFQDHIGNMLTQWGLAVQQNLVNPVFYDADKLPKEYVKALENMGQKMMNGTMFFPFSSTENWRMNTNQREAFYQPQFARHNTGEISTLISGVLSMLDRIMQLSPQEIGQAASHEQTAEESKIVARNTSTRVEFTGTFIDSGDHAKKVMLYDAMMAHADEEIVVGITSNLAGTEEEFKKLLDQLGLTIDDKSTYDPSNPGSARKVKGKKSAMRIENFASTRDKADRSDNAAVADAMSKIFLSIANNPVLIQSIGTVQLVELLNQIIVTAGLPKEFKLRGQNIDTAAPQEDQTAELSKMLEGMAAQVKQLVDQSSQQVLQAAGEQTVQLVGEAISGISQQLAPMAEAVAQGNQVNQLQEQKLEELSQAVGQLGEVVAQVAQAVPPPVQPPPQILEPVIPSAPVGVPV